MITLREAATMALEALEQIAVLAEYGTTGPGKCHSRALNAQQATALRLSVSDLSRSQITALRAALAEPVQEPVWVCPDSAEHRYGKPGHCEDCGKTLVQVAEPVQEPVAWLFTNLQSGDYDFCYQEDEHDHDREMWHKQPLYTAPPQRKPRHVSYVCPQCHWSLEEATTCPPCNGNCNQGRNCPARDNK